MKRPMFTFYLLFILMLVVPAVTTTAQAGEYNQKMAKQKQMSTDEVASETAKKRAKKRKNKMDDAAGNAATPAATIAYDKTSDHLSIKVDNASLKAVLARVAKLSGIEVFFDDAAEESVSVDIQSESLDKGLKVMLKGRNSALRYSRDENNKLLLIGVTVLPAGTHGSGNAKRIKSLRVEAYDRASTLTHEQLHQVDVAMQRWQARMSQLSPERLKALEERVNARLLKKAIRKQKLAEKRKAYEEKRAKSAAKEQMMQDRKLEHLTAEQLANYHQVRAEARERVRVLMHGDNKQ